MWKLTRRSLGAHKRRLLATCSAVLLGVAFLAGTLVMGDTMTAGFSDIFAKSNAGLDALVRSRTEVGQDDITQRGMVDAALAQRIAKVDGVAQAAAVVEGDGRIVGKDGDPIGGDGPPTIAGNWLGDTPLNPYQLAEGRAPTAPGEVVIDKAAAHSGKLHLGDATTIRLASRPIDVKVVGIATFGGAESAGPMTYAAFSNDFASHTLVPDPGDATSIRVAADPGVSQSELVQRIEPVLPKGDEAMTGAQRTAEMEDQIQGDFLGFFRTFLVIFAGIALVVATFSIYNTFSILVAQRTRESALVRALGGSRGQVLRSVTAEALVVGVVASLAGIAAGIGLAQGLMALFRAMGATLPMSNLVIGGGSMAVAFAVGVVVTLVASLIPAVRASRTAPLAALRDVAVDRSGTSWLRAGIGALLTAAGVAGVIAGTSGDGVFALTGLGAIATLIGVVVLGPVVARPAAGVLAAPQAARRRLSGTLARRNAMRNPRRTAGTASALMVGVAVVSLFTVVGASIKQSIDNTVRDQFGGDLVIASSGFSGSGLSPELAREVAGLPQVGTASALANTPMQVDGKNDVGTAYDPVTFDRMLDVGVEQGSLADLTADQIAVSHDYADSHHLRLGSPLPVAWGDGTKVDLKVGGIYAKEDLIGAVTMPYAAYLPHADNPTDVVVMIDVAKGVGLHRAETAIQKVADRFGAPDVQTADEYVASVAGQVDQMLVVVYVLLVLAIVIALMGIANTLSLSIHERTRELGLLRAVGQTRRQVRAMVRGEAATVALFGTVGGVGLGVFLGWAMVDTLASEGFTSFAIPTVALAVILALGALVGVVAAIRPARRAARMDILAAIATE
jgi:putative ABC transport system permease protein